MDQHSEIQAGKLTNDHLGRTVSLVSSNTEDTVVGALARVVHIDQGVLVTLSVFGQPFETQVLAGARLRIE